MKNKTKAFIALFSLAVLLSLSAANAEGMQQVNYSVPASPLSYASFFVTTLKYDPYPVNAGEWFDLWIKVQNIGEGNAPDASFELSPQYPFSSNDSLLRDYGLVYGTVDAHRISADLDSSQVILKYRVKVADNAPDGTSNLKLIVKTDSSSSATSFDIPVEIAKTKTDFDVRVRSVNPQESSFIVTNIGDNTAKAVKADVKGSEGIVFLNDAQPADLGDMGQGDFTIAHMKVLPGTSGSMTLEISYTDTVGVRDVVEKTVDVSGNVQSMCSVNSGNGYMDWTFGAIGLVTGIFLMVIAKMIIKGIRTKRK